MDDIVLVFTDINTFLYKIMKRKSNLICAFLEFALLIAFHSSLQAGVWNLMPTFTVCSLAIMSSSTSTPWSFTAFQTTMRSSIPHWRISRCVSQRASLELLLLRVIPGSWDLSYAGKILRLLVLRSFFPFGRNQEDWIRTTGFIIMVYGLQPSHHFCF